ncbi:hypothetical protein [Granulicella paludicola]|uniref:hypothetical protein n=1 Tax=Granulicella paludicola TaxID=474951 RepID=UPI0021DF4EB0|nr:hypothetical protein [Granulicella paludicola]
MTSIRKSSIATMVLTSIMTLGLAGCYHRHHHDDHYPPPPPPGEHHDDGGHPDHP